MIAGVATDTMVESTRIMKKPRHSAKRAGHGLTSGGVVPAQGTGSLAGFVVWAMSQPNTRQPTFHPGRGTPRSAQLQRGLRPWRRTLSLEPRPRTARRY